MTATEAIEVIELGEDGGSWLVLNATEDEVAPAIIAWLDETWGGEMEVGCWHSIRTAEPTLREDWYWEPVSDEQPEDEAFLRSVAHDGTTARPTFTGYLVQL